MKKQRPKGVSAADWDAVDSPAVGSDMIARMRPARLGRPPQGERAKQQVTLRLDADIIERFRSQGAGWQTRINEILRRSAAKMPAKAEKKRPGARKKA